VFSDIDTADDLVRWSLPSSHAAKNGLLDYSQAKLTALFADRPGFHVSKVPASDVTNVKIRAHPIVIRDQRANCEAEIPPDRLR
jgi:hypothetical protein